MGYKCPQCEEYDVTYEGINNSRCENCGKTVPNAHVSSLDYE